MTLPTDPRLVLARNLRALIDRDTPRGRRPSVRAWALSHELDVRLIDRLTKGEHAVTLDKLDDIAQACGLQAWQLLLPDLDPAAPPTQPITREEHEMLERLRSLLGRTTT